MDDAERVLAVLWRSRDRAVTDDWLTERVALVYDDDVPAVDDVLAALLADGRLHRGPDGVRLAEEAWDAARRAFKQTMREGFDASLVTYEDSPAYRAYNLEVYGWERFSFNMIDAEQRQLLIGRCGLQPGQRFVDLGCATGALTAWVAEETGAQGLGVDFAPKAVAAARHAYPSVDFEVQDLDDLQLGTGCFDVALALDTLYFPHDLAATLRRVFASLRPGGRLLTFYSGSAEEDGGGASLSLADTKLGAALDEVGAALELTDVTDGSARVWRAARAAIDRARPAFEAEGLAHEWAQRDREIGGQLARVQAGRKRRWLVEATG